MLVFPVSINAMLFYPRIEVDALTGRISPCLHYVTRTLKSAVTFLSPHDFVPGFTRPAR